jgi:hypothetical protein
MTVASITWVLECDVFPNGDCLRAGAAAAGHRIVDWSDESWSDPGRLHLDGTVIFHGSLGNADRVARELSWSPGAYCNTEAFRCSTWYPGASPWLLHRKWEVLPASRFVAEADAVLSRLGLAGSAFVRPDSPLKPFSGRVLHRDQITLAAMDHGFYYDDPDLAIVVAPVRSVSREWRYVVAGNHVVAGSAYLSDGRTAVQDDPRGAPWQFAAEVAERMAAPEDVYVLDVCESDGGLHLLELNPFSGADLYACNGVDVVTAVAAIATAAARRKDR